MNDHLSLFIIVMLFIIYVIVQGKERKTAAIIHYRKKYKNKEIPKMKELAQQFIGKECLIYTIASGSSSVLGVIKEVTENGLLIEKDENLQAVNLEYVTRIREYPRKKNGKKKSVVLD